MAKRSRAETERTINQIMDEALKQLLTLGYDSMSYTTLSQATGISRTGISHHFPHKANFLVRLDPQISHLFQDELDFTSLTTLEGSWIRALQQPKCCMVLRLFFSLCGDLSKSETQFKAIDLVKDKAYKAFGFEGERMISELLGRSAVLLLPQT
ncbi:TetR family transcriptional regulator [Shewanella sp. D64]|uniref:TetR family transcriptional regulator n=1 Tax=unclassified Shewanella TaxID=196818 RepID=UPI0022BA2D0F|nr:MULTISPECIES: TetR family transcriptional regulator [unclassified Shewanella]MEC4727459.1 TetR family transcriptional regulator [Shewanella sp. D64]MEC4738132.1 TetR family transcriptional regulator [Shewanella sp. E94]WBJ96355.1 TetR family transcriptional regulator [Shewanella sp. MTB7]